MRRWLRWQLCGPVEQLVPTPAVAREYEGVDICDSNGAVVMC